MNSRRCCAVLLLLAGSVLPIFAERPIPARQQARHFERQITITAKLDYLLSLPAGYEQRPRDRWPLVLFLHGSGESGSELSKVKIHGLPKLAEKHGAFPFILVSPQSPRGDWNPDVLNAFLDDIVRKYRVDKNRVYLTGLSMGGYGTWALAAAHPEKFAAIAPICGGGEIEDAPKLANMPIWVFHGAKDATVPLQASKDMVEALKAAGGKPKFTIYPDAGHDSWTVTYENPEFYQWLLAQNRARR